MFIAVLLVIQLKSFSFCIIYYVILPCFASFTTWTLRIETNRKAHISNYKSMEEISQTFKSNWLESNELSRHQNAWFCIVFCKSRKSFVHFPLIRKFASFSKRNNANIAKTTERNKKLWYRLKGKWKNKVNKNNSSINECMRRDSDSKQLNQAENAF